MASKNSFLFIGGVKDGERICVANTHRVDVPVRSESTPIRASSDCGIARIAPIRCERYVAMTIPGFHNNFIVYAEESLCVDDVLEMLILNYAKRGEK